MGGIPPYACERSLFALSRASGRRNGSPTVFRRPLLLGRPKTRRTRLHSRAFLHCVALQPLQPQPACSQVRFRRFFCPPVRFAMVRFTALIAAPGPEMPCHARPVPPCSVLRPSAGFLYAPRPLRASWRRVARHPPRFCSGMFRFAPRVLSSRTQSTLRTSSACHSLPASCECSPRPCCLWSLLVHSSPPV